jgi:NDP-sugar pyrophosphorylase family protein
MLDAHEGSITVGVRPYVHTVPFGCIEAEGSRIVRIEEKPQLARLVNAGIYVLSADVLGRVSPGVNFPITALIDRTIEAGEMVTAFEISDEWADIGAHDQLRLARGAA